MRYMLDTNICIYIIKRKPESVLNRFRTLRIGDIVLSAITYSELWFGVQKSSKKDQNAAALELFTAPLEIVPFTDSAGKAFGEVRSYLEGSGRPIGPLDTLISAHAVALDLTLVTNNTNEFSRIPQLKLENWV